MDTGDFILSLRSAFISVIITLLLAVPLSVEYGRADEKRRIETHYYQCDTLSNGNLHFYKND